MRRALGLGCAVALWAAAPAAAAPQTVLGTDDLVFAPAHVAVAPGEAVTWRFDGTVQAHNVAANGAEPALPDWDAFTTPTKVAPPPVSYTFTAPGVYRFICTVHPDTMVGTVTVGENALPQGSAPPLSQQPLANDAPAGVVVEKVSLDKAKPKLTSVRASRAARGAVRVRFRVDEESTVQVRLRRGGRTVRSATVEGTGRRSVTLRRAPAGRYRVEVRATDVAGNRSRWKKTAITVR
jgi:plastocyanin